MTESTDIKGYFHLERDVPLPDGTTRDAISGYITYKDGPLFKAQGWRNDDKKGVSKKTKKPYHIMSYNVSLFEGEDTKDEDFKRPERLTLMLADRERRSDKAPFQVLRTDQIYNVETREPTKGFPIPNTDMVVCLQGIVPDRTIQVKKGENEVTVTPIVLEVNKQALTTMAMDFSKPVEERVGYTASSPGDLISDDMAASLKEQFKYFGGFMKTFEKPESKVEEGAEY